MRLCMQNLNIPTKREQLKIRIIRLNEVISRTGYGRTSIYRKMEEGTFPKSLKLGGPLKDKNTFDSSAVGWLEHEVDQWVQSIIEERDSNLIK